MNPLPDSMTIGTLGELLVQLRLLELDVQAAPPLKDSGNDLAAFRGRSVKTVQVKTSRQGMPPLTDPDRELDVVALVRLNWPEKTPLRLDAAEIYLVPYRELEALRVDRAASLENYALSETLVARIWDASV